MDWPLFAWVVFKSVLFSSGGFGPLPSLHADFLAYGWATEYQFTEALTIGQLSPGPNGLWVLSLCYLVAGIPGALIASFALLVPPLLVLLVYALYARIAHRPGTQGLLDGVVLVIVSFSLLVMTQIFASNGIDIPMLALAAVSAALAWSRKVPTNAILALGAGVGFWLG